MNRMISPNKLNEMIKQYASDSVENRQVARRLKDLLASRLGEIKRDYQRSNPAQKSWRLALADTRYEDFVEEFVAISHDSLRSKLQYETHLMLVQARQSLRVFHRR